MAYEAYCAACTYMGERCYGSKYWCEIKGEDRSAADPKCCNFCEAYSRSNSARQNMYENSGGSYGSGCYLTTIMCKLLNYPDNNYYLNTLRKFRDNVMKTNPKYIPLLITYDMIGPMIAYELERDSNGKEIAQAFFNNYITKSVTAIEEEKYESAINIYKVMTNELGNRYNISKDIKPIEISDYNLLGHARIKRKLV